jgi:hypothetical protein
MASLNHTIGHACKNSKISLISLANKHGPTAIQNCPKNHDGHAGIQNRATEIKYLFRTFAIDCIFLIFISPVNFDM